MTLPLVSYGGSSLLSTLIIFAVIQGLYLLRERTAAERQAQRKQSVKKPLANKQSGSARGDSVKKPKRKGGGLSHEENIHGTKVKNLD